MKHKILYFLFVFMIVGVSVYGAFYVYYNINSYTGKFETDGYAIYLSDKSSANVLPFSAGTDYSYKKYDSKVSFVSESKGVKVDDSTIIHYQNNNLLMLKNVIGIDLDNISKEIIVYYNIFKNTELKYDNNQYNVTGVDNENINFKKLLVRVNDDKYLLSGEGIRVVFPDEKIVEFDKYLYFEYASGSIVRVYNDDNYYQTVDDAQIVIGDVTIDLKTQIIEKENKKYITLSNISGEKDADVDVITVEGKVEKIDIKKPNIDEDIITGKKSESGSSEGNSGGVVNNSGSIVEDTVDSKYVPKEPIFKVKSMSLTALKIDAAIEITDADATLVGNVEISIVENATAREVYEATLEDGNLYIEISYPNLSPDTEYTLYAKGSYKIDEITYEKNFISKIFRTEALGVSFEKSYVTNDSIVIDINREKYSKVSSVTVAVIDDNQTVVDFKTIYFTNQRKVELAFKGLDHNREYTVKMYDILSSGVIVDGGYNQIEKIKTLKVAPKFGTLTYAVNKFDSTFELDVSKVIDEDYGITGYRYEVFDARSDLSRDLPLVVIKKDSLGPVSVKVDESKIHRGVAYTYRLVAEYYDNEKNVEYIENLGRVMQMDGVAFPTLRFEENFITWEQINGAIVIDDPSGTIMSDEYRVVYKNSIDFYSSDVIKVTTPKNSIPINVKYLRANETYTFDVYATINLQDGNDPADQTYIGSVKVQTLEPKPLTASFKQNNSYTDAFSIDFKLSSAGEDASFEASTLTSLTFTLYQGNSTNGKVEVYKREVDSNNDEYTSDLKAMFYDVKKVLDAAFFNSQNSDFHQKNYTLVVDQAYDYTGYDSNIIPIENNVFNFELQNYIPNIPDPDETQVIVNPIINKLAESFGLEYDETLEPNTVVGYNLSGTYDNSTMSAKYIIYHTYRYNHLTEEYDLLSSLDRRVNFASDGTLPSEIFLVSNGTGMDISDTDTLRRGNKYYFTFEVFIDMDGDNVVDTIFPRDVDAEAVLKSEEIEAKKQGAIFKLYPSLSTGNTSVWKYKSSDIDNALADNKLYGHINSSLTSSSSATITPNNTNYLSATFTGLAEGNNLTIVKQERLIKSDDIVSTNILSQYFYGFISSPGTGFVVHELDNKLSIELTNLSKLSQVAYIDVLVKPVNQRDIDRLGTKTIRCGSAPGGEIIIDYYTIKEYIDVDCKISLYIYFDTGETGFDYTNTYGAIQSASYDEPGYYYVISGSRLVPGSSLYGNIATLRFDNVNNQINITSLSGARSIVNVDVDQSGVVYAENNIIMKNIARETRESSSSEFKFNYIIPGVSLLGSGNKLNITPLLEGVYVKAKITDPQTNPIKDDLIYMDIYEVNENGYTGDVLKTMTNPLSDFSSDVLIDGLKAQTNYYFTIYVYLLNRETGVYEKQYLYDTDQKATEIMYRFNTLSDVGIDNFNAELVTNSYTDKYISIDYTLENVTGYDRIEYEVYKVTDSGNVLSNIIIPDSTVFYKKMHLSINATPRAGSDIMYGGTYMIRMKPIGLYDLNGTIHELDLGTREFYFTLSRYEEPYIGINAGRLNNSLFFKVSVNDDSHIIMNDVYDIVLLDSEGNIIASVKNNSIFGVNKRFDFDETIYSLQAGEKYTFVVMAKLDYLNDGDFDIEYTKIKDYQFGAVVDVGTVVLTPNTSNDSSIDMIFSDAYRLDLIDKITYSISSVNSGFYYSSTEGFVTRYDNNADLYYYTLNIDDPNYNPSVIYLVTVNFYKNGELVKTLELDYYAGGSDDET